MNKKIDVHEEILTAITYNDLVLMAKNINPETGDLTDEFLTLLDKQVQEAKELFSLHYDDICKEAGIGGDAEQQDNIPLSKETIAALAKEIYDFLIKEEMWSDVSIYFNGICWSTSDAKGNDLHDNKEKIFVYEAEPRDYFQYVRAQGNILSMTFEGPLYYALNYNYDNRQSEELSEIMRKYGLYYELGNAWNLTCDTI